MPRNCTTHPSILFPSVKFNPLPGWSAYLIGDNGSVWKFSVRGRRANPGNEWSCERIYRIKGGYERVCLCQDGREKTRTVHQLVLEAHVGLRPEGLECRHLNSIPWDNRLSNLAWGTKKENEKDKADLRMWS